MIFCTRITTHTLLQEQTILEWAQHIDAVLKGIIKTATDDLDYPAIVKVLVE